MIEVIRTLDDAVNWAKQWHDMVHGDIMTLANPDRATVILYKAHLEQVKTIEQQGEVVVKQLKQITSLKMEVQKLEEQLLKSIVTKNKEKTT